MQEFGATLPILGRPTGGGPAESLDLGDAVKVNTELERSISVPVEAHDAGEEERRHLLKAVAGHMRKCPDLLESGSQSPELKLSCVCSGTWSPAELKAGGRCGLD